MLRSWLPTRTRPIRKSRPAAATRRKTHLDLETFEDRTVLSSTRTLGGLQFLTPGEFETQSTAGGTLVRTNEPVSVGLAGGDFQPLMKFTDGVSFLDGDPFGQFTAAGEIHGVIGDLDIPLAESGERSFTAESLLEGGAGLLSDQSLSVGGMEFTLSGVELDEGAVKLQGKLAMPQLAGLVVAVEGNDHVVIDEDGLHLTGLDATVSDVHFGRGGLGFDINTLNVHYSSSGNTFELTGDGAIQIAGKEVGLSFGDEENPGILIEDGTLTRLAGTITTPEIALGGARIQSAAMTLEYEAPSSFAITGSGGLEFGRNTIAVELGDAEQGTKGLVIENGQLQSLDMAVSADISLGGATLTADALRIEYDRPAATYVVSGSSELVFGSQRIGVELGDADQGTKGLVIENGQLRSLDMAVNADINLGGLTFAADNLRVAYDQLSATYIVSGSAGVTILQNSASVELGQDGTDGIVIQNGKLLRIDAALSGTIQTMGTKLEVDRARLVYDAEDSSYEVSGGVSLSTISPTTKLFNRVAARLGNDEVPGLRIADGQLESLHVVVDGDFNLFGIRVAPKGLTVDYNRGASQLSLTGSLTIKPTPKHSFTAGLPNGGITIDTQTGDVAVNGVEFSTTLDFKAVQVRNFLIGFTKSAIDGYTVYGKGEVRIAGAGVQGAFTFRNGELASIGLGYVGTGIPIGQTGAFFTRLYGQVDNLDNLENAAATVKAQVTYGKSVRFQGKDYAVFIADGELKVSKDDLDLKGAVSVVGGLLGSGNGRVTLNWAAQEYTIVANVSMYAGVFKVNGAFTVNRFGDVTLDATGSVQLPKLPKAMQEFQSIVPTSAWATANLRLEIHPGNPKGTYISAKASAWGWTAEYRYDGLNGFTAGLFQGAAQWAAGFINSAGDVFKQSWNYLGNSWETWAYASGTTISKYFVRYNPAQIGVSYVHTFVNGAETARDTLYYGSLYSREFFSNGWAQGWAGATRTIQYFGHNARTVYMTLKSGGGMIKETVYSTGERVWEELNSAGKVVETWTKEVGQGWKKVETGITSGFKKLKFW